MKQGSHGAHLLLAATSMLLALFLLPGQLRGQSSAAPYIQTWTGITSQGERFLIVVEGGDTITLVNVGVHLYGKDYGQGHEEDCVSRRTVTHHGFLGYVVDGGFTISVENEHEQFVMHGALGHAPSGWLLLAPRQALQSACAVGATQATWWVPGQSGPPLPPAGEASIPVPPPTSPAFWPTATPSPTPRLDPPDPSWEGVPEWAQPTMRPEPAPTDTPVPPYPEP